MASAAACGDGGGKTLGGGKKGREAAHAGQWYATFPTSNVQSERQFGRMRGMETSLTGARSAESLVEELMGACNKDVAALVLSRALTELKKI